MKKHTYRAIEMHDLRLQELLPLLAAGCIVAIDVAKAKFAFALATVNGEVLKILRFQHPTETAAFLELVQTLKATLPGVPLRVAMEPTGTYGDAVRYQLAGRGIPVFMVSPKRTHDSQEIFDGVPGVNDPKSAVLLAKLCALNLGTPWQRPGEWRARMRALVERRQLASEQEERCHGRLEALLSRHWPEFFRWMDTREQKSAVALLEMLADPASVAASPDKPKELLHRVSRGRLSKEAIEGVVTEARTTLGVPMMAEERQFVMELAATARVARESAEAIEEEMSRLGGNDIFQRLQDWMGTFTAATLMALCEVEGMCGEQLEKACGLNLHEDSSGEHKGDYSITKRGPSELRRVLYMFALRMIQESAVVSAWYERRRGHTDNSKKSAVVAVMRKLLRALPHVARGAKFDATKLFDTRRLTINPNHPASLPSRQPTPRTRPRSIARSRNRQRTQSTVSP